MSEHLPIATGRPEAAGRAATRHGLAAEPRPAGRTRTPRRRSRWRRLYKATRRASNFGLRLGLWLLIAFAAVAIASAYFDDDYTLGRFEVPEAAAAAGYTPEVVPRRIHDAMLTMQARSASVRDFRGFSSGRRGGGGVDISVAGFGVSFESVARRLREVTGRTERVFAGEVTAEGDTVRLALRQNGRLLDRYTEYAPAGGMDAALSRLFERAARRVYRVTEPYLMAVLLDDGDEAERAEAVEVIEELLEGDDAAERPWALNFLGNRSRDLGDTATARRLYGEALVADPSFRLGYNNLFAVYQVAGELDSMLAVRARAERRLGHDDRDLLWQMDYMLAMRDTAHPARLRALEREAIARVGDSDEARYRVYGLIAERLNRGRAARSGELAAEALEASPLDDHLLTLRVLTALLVEDWAEADAYLGRLQLVEADSTLLDASRGWLLVGRDSVAQGRELLERAYARGGLDEYGTMFEPLGRLYVAYRSGDTARQREIVERLYDSGMPEDMDTDVSWFEELAGRYGPAGARR